VAQLRAYLEHVIRKAEKPPVYLGKHRPLDTYVPPDVYRSPSGDVVDEDTDEEVTDDGRPATEADRVDWESECELALHAATPWRAAVLGPPGQGKSLLLMMLARQLALGGLEALQAAPPDLGKVPLPVVVQLNDLANAARKRKPRVSWDKFLRRALRQLLHGECPTPGAWSKAIKHIIQRVRGQSVWLLLDALDEVPDPSQLIEMLETLENWRCNALVSARPHAYEAIRFPFQVTEYRLAPFSPTQIDVFLQRWLPVGDLQQKIRSVLKGSGSISRMAANPLLLTLLCGFAERHGVSDKITRSELYKGVLRDLLGLAADKRSKIDHHRADVWLPLLTDLMWESFWKDGGRPMATGELLVFIANNDNRPTPLGIAAAELSKMNRWQQAEELLEELRKKGILVPIDGRRSAYAMLHRSFTEYLAARALSDTLEGRRPTLVIDPTTGSTATASELWKVLDKKAWSPEWENVVLFTAGQLRDPKPLLATLSASETDDWFRHRLALAALCLGEISVPARKTCAEPIQRTMADLFDFWWGHALHRAKANSGGVRIHRGALEQIIQLDSDVYHIGLLDRLSQRLQGDSPANRGAAAVMVSFVGPVAASPGVVAALPGLLDRHKGLAIMAVESIGLRQGLPILLTRFWQC
jgi:hypothetical protein